MRAITPALGGIFLFPSMRILVGIQSDKSDDADRSIRTESHYLNFPVKNGVASQRLRMLVGGKVEHEFYIEFVDTEPDSWAFMDVSRFQGAMKIFELKPVWK